MRATAGRAAALLLGGALLACPVDRGDGSAAGDGQQSAQQAQQPQQPGQGIGDTVGGAGGNGNEQARAQRQQTDQRLRIEVQRRSREAHMYLDGQRVRTFRVAVGDSEHPTPTGDFAIHQVDWNPDWTPPDSDWASDASYQPPGAADNPMGRVRMIYQAPFSLHGTDNIESLGSAESHGSIRVANQTIIEIGRIVMEHGGQGRDDRWYRRVLGNRTEMVKVDLTNPVPLRILD